MVIVMDLVSSAFEWWPSVTLIFLAKLSTAELSDETCIFVATCNGMIVPLKKNQLWKECI